MPIVFLDTPDVIMIECITVSQTDNLRIPNQSKEELVWEDWNSERTTHEL